MEHESCDCVTSHQKTRQLCHASRSSLTRKISGLVRSFKILSSPLLRWVCLVVILKSETKIFEVYKYLRHLINEEEDWRRFVYPLNSLGLFHEERGFFSVQVSKLPYDTRMRNICHQRQSWVKTFDSNKRVLLTFVSVAECTSAYRRRQLSRSTYTVFWLWPRTYLGKQYT